MRVTILCLLIFSTFLTGCGKDNETVEGNHSFSNPFESGGPYISTPSQKRPLKEFGFGNVLFLYDDGRWEIQGGKRGKLRERGSWRIVNNSFRLDYTSYYPGFFLLKGFAQSIPFQGKTCLRLADRLGFRIFCP